ncbi:hypothetical protein V496_00281 [Pseudogymnoascus sp. VKM F-4515 (FW-2607)]|nr:hypothetical protein V496_00281 [Pseudogymnoascus sp. VKM F-4515 (FW-2607)]
MQRVEITGRFILASAMDLLKILHSKERLPEQASDLQEELLGFHMALESFGSVTPLNEELQSYLVNCCDLCIKLKLRDDLLLDEAKTIVSVATHMLGMCRMAVLIRVFWNILHNGVATPNVVAGFRSAVKDFLTYLGSITQLEKIGNTLIMPPTQSLIFSYKEMFDFDFKSKSMAEIGASTDYQIVVCTPEEAMSPTNLGVFEKHTEQAVLDRKLAVMSGDQPNSSAKLSGFLQQLAAEEESNIRLERTFFFTETKLIRPDSVFSLIGIYLTNVKAISATLPITIIDGSDIVSRSKTSYSGTEEEECGICLEAPTAGQKCEERVIEILEGAGATPERVRKRAGGRYTPTSNRAYTKTASTCHRDCAEILHVVGVAAKPEHHERPDVHSRCSSIADITPLVRGSYNGGTPLPDVLGSAKLMKATDFRGVDCQAATCCFPTSLGFARQGILWLPKAHSILNLTAGIHFGLKVPGYTRHLPASARIANLDSIAVSAEGLAQKESAREQLLRHAIQPQYLDPLWVLILETINENPGFHRFRGATLFLNAKNTKLELNRTSLTEAYEVSSQDTAVPYDQIPEDHEAEVFLWKKCCLDAYSRTRAVLNVDGSKAKGNPKRTTYNWATMRDSMGLTLFAAPQGAESRDGLIYSQFYRLIKTFDSAKVYVFDNDSAENLALDPGYWVQWDLYDADDDSGGSHPLPYYIVPTNELLSFLYAQINKYCFLFEHILAHTARTYSLPETMVMVVALRALRFCYGSNLLIRESRLYKNLWEVRRGEKLMVKEGLGMVESIERCGLGWFLPKFNWKTWRLAAPHGDNILLGNLLMHKEYKRRWRAVKDLRDVYIRFNQAESWYKQYNMEDKQGLEKVWLEYLIALNLEQFDVDVQRAMLTASKRSHELRPDAAQLMDAMKFCHHNMRKMFMVDGAAGPPHMVIGNKMRFGKVMGLLNFLFLWDEQERPGWGNKPYRVILKTFTLLRILTEYAKKVQASNECEIGRVGFCQNTRKSSVHQPQFPQ